MLKTRECRELRRKFPEELCERLDGERYYLVDVSQEPESLRHPSQLAKLADDSIYQAIKAAIAEDLINEPINLAEWLRERAWGGSKFVRLSLAALVELEAWFNPETEEWHAEEIEVIVEDDDDETIPLTHFDSDIETPDEGTAVYKAIAAANETRDKQTITTLRRDLKAANKAIVDLTDLLDATKHFKDQLPQLQPRNIRYKEPKQTLGEATAIALASDWHVGEHITLDQTDGSNEYDLEIAQARSQAFFQNFLRLVEIQRNGVNVQECILWLGGDLIDNWLREENIETSLLSPTEQVVYVYQLFLDGINYLAEHGGFNLIEVVCSDGNHGRLPMQRRVKAHNRVQNSMENMMYQLLAMQFEHVENVNFHVATEYFTYLQLYDKTLRFHHGDNIRGGGTGSLSSALGNKVANYIKKINAIRPADMDFIGHFHSCQRLPNCFINGSLCGPNPYSITNGFASEVPAQQFLLLDKERGFTVNAPIFLTPSKRSAPNNLITLPKVA